ncbi:MAG: RNA 2',3'-cyclic phosphodiesterase [Nitrospirota bacterium]
MYLRCFIAIEISEPIKKKIGELMGILKRYNGDVKWAEPQNIHITLKFLGKTPDSLVPRISDSLSNIVLSYEPFYIKISDVGVFPSRRHPRVIWVGVKDSEILGKLKMDIEDSMEPLGFEKEDRDFKPHLTLGRARSQSGMANIINELDNFKENDFGSLRVTSIRLMQSELKPTGAFYHCLYEASFGGKF